MQGLLSNILKENRVNEVMNLILVLLKMDQIVQQNYRCIE
jgi:hypothetical protein